MVPILAKTLFGRLWPQALSGLTISAVVTDSRRATPGSVFVAIKGQRVDGHDFAAEAFRNGAAVVVAQHPVEGVPPERTVVCEDILDTMIEIGANYRDQFHPLILGVTGSVGKTTTKEFCAAVFSAFDVTLKTDGNQNNEIGLPNTLFRLDDSVRYAVLEMGMQGLGEIHKLTMAARPDGAVITRIGTAHIEALGSVENILKAKLEICDGLPFGAPLVLNGDDELLRHAAVPDGVRPVYAGLEEGPNEVRAGNIRREGKGTYFRILDSRYGENEAFIPTIGRHNLANALLAYTAATRLGLNPSQAAAGLVGYHPAGMRQRIVEKNGVTMIEDCYNANPESMEAALSVMEELEVGGRRIAVLGDMLELGATSEVAHRRLGVLCAQKKVDMVVTVGQMAALIAWEAEKAGIEATVCVDNAEAAGLLSRLVKTGDAVLVKASRGMKFEEILEEFTPLAS